MKTLNVLKKTMILLVIAMIVCLFAACGDDAGDADGTSSAALTASYDTIVESRTDNEDYDHSPVTRNPSAYTAPEDSTK